MDHEVDSRNDVGVREQAFWDQHVPPFALLLRRYERGPVGNTRALLEAIEPVRGTRVLDFACGAGITAAFLAQRGALVTALDISPVSIQRARELAQHLHLTIEFVNGELTPTTFRPNSFDAIVGRYALHHVDLRVIAPIFNEILVPGGSGAFLETMGLNPLLNLARRRLAGHCGVASYGSEDERPVERSDLRILERHLGPVQLEVGKMQFLRIFDRNVPRFRHRRAAALLGQLDDAMARLGLGFLSYHQVVKVVKPATAA
jgi:SAM-dependent methyltransferase